MTMPSEQELPPAVMDEGGEPTQPFEAGPATALPQEGSGGEEPDSVEGWVERFRAAMAEEPQPAGGPPPEAPPPTPSPAEGAPTAGAAAPEWWEKLSPADLERLREHPLWAQIRERATQSEVDRAIAALQHGRIQDIPPKLREFVQRYVQVDPNVVQPLTAQAYAQGQEQAQTIAAYERLGALLDAYDEGDAEAAERIQQEFRLDVRAARRAHARYELWKEQVQQQQAAAQWQPYYQQAYRQAEIDVASRYAEANLQVLRRMMPGLSDLSEGEWERLLAEGRQKPSYEHLLQHLFQAALDRVQSKRTQQQKEQAQALTQAQERLRSLPVPDTSRGAANTGTTVPDYITACKLYTEGRISDAEFARYKRKFLGETY